MQNKGVALLSQLVLRTLFHGSTERVTGMGQRWTDRAIRDGVRARHGAGHAPATPAVSAASRVRVNGRV